MHLLWETFDKTRAFLIDLASQQTPRITLQGSNTSIHCEFTKYKRIRWMRVKFSDFVSIFHDHNIIILCVCVHFRPECPMDMTGKCPLGIVYVKPPNVSIWCVSLCGAAYFLMTHPVSLKLSKLCLHDGLVFHSTALFLRVRQWANLLPAQTSVHEKHNCWRP